MKIEARPLGGTPFAEAWLAGDAGAAAFLPGDPAVLDSYRTRADAIGRSFGEVERREIAAELTGGGERAAERIAAFVQAGGFMVTTGQQPGLFGGPLYALYKGLTAAALAERLEAELGRPVLPVFWIASEHHGWDDLRTAHLIDPENELRELSLSERSVPAVPAHRIELGNEVSEVVELLLSLMPETEFLPGWAALLRRSHVPGTTLVEAFRIVMEELMGPAGVFLIRADAPGMKSRALPLLLRELRESGARARAGAAVATDLRRAGFEPQVPVLDGATNLFLEGPSGRERIFEDVGGYRLRGSETRLTYEEVEAHALADPSRLSPNVLLRPVVEAAFLPTLAYVGGPGEIAYLPQAAPVFEGHGIERPVVHPRVSLVVVERKVEKVLRKFDLELDTMARPHHELAGRIAREEMPSEIREGLASLRTGIGGGAEELARAAAAVDPTLRGAVESFRGQATGLIEDLERKIVQGIKRENEIALTQLAKAQLNLFPLGQPQERVLHPFQFLVRYDREFLSLVMEKARSAVLF